MPSFNISIKADLPEVRNALEQASKEILNRFDFKGTSAAVKFTDAEIICTADNDFQLSQVKDVFFGKCAKRKVDTRLFQQCEITKISGDKVKQNLRIIDGIEVEIAKNIVKYIKSKKIKVQSSIQGNQVKVYGPKKDSLQEIISNLKEDFKNHPLVFDNFRD